MKSIKKSTFVSQRIINSFIAILCVLIIMPFLLLVSISVSNEADIIKNGYSLIPREFDLSAYKYVFNNPSSIFNAYKVTAAFSVISMILGTMLIAMTAYPLTRKYLKGRRSISFYLYFTMLFNGGLVPTYILITQYLHLQDSIWVYIVPGLISPWYVFMMRTFFSDIPDAIIESAYIDGAGEIKIFFTIILSLSKPVFSTVALFTILAKWNDWYTSMLYINQDNLISLQYLLQKIIMNLELLQNSKFGTAGIISVKDIPSETTRMAMAVLVAGPALLVFPFFQKYFVKGLTVGSVKG